MIRLFDRLSTTPGSSFVIFETDTDYEDKAFRKWATIEELPYQEVFGQYYGHYNRAFVVPKPFWHKVFPWYVNQESVLYLQPDGDTYNAALYWLKEDKLEPIGMWKEIPARDVGRYEGATLEPISGRWFTTTGTKRLHRPAPRSVPNIVAFHEPTGPLSLWPIYPNPEQTKEEKLKEAWADYRGVVWDNEAPPERVHAFFAA